MATTNVGSNRKASISYIDPLIYDNYSLDYATTSYERSRMAEERSLYERMHRERLEAERAAEAKRRMQMEQPPPGPNWIWYYDSAIGGHVLKDNVPTGKGSHPPMAKSDAPSPKRGDDERWLNHRIAEVSVRL